jgi:DNA-binding transcriptional LysR family regulator
MPCMKELAHKSAGITILPPSAVTREVLDGRLVRIPLQPSLVLTAVLGQTPHRPQTQATKAVFGVLQELAQSLMPQNGWRCS